MQLIPSEVSGKQARAFTLLEAIVCLAILTTTGGARPRRHSARPLRRPARSWHAPDRPHCHQAIILGYVVIDREWFLEKESR
jgi:hypothetical protein